MDVWNDLFLDVLGPRRAILDLDPDHAWGEVLRRCGHFVLWVRGALPGERLPLADGSCEVVAARHLASGLAAPHRAIEEWLRVLRPHGTLLLLEAKPTLRRRHLLFAPSRSAHRSAPFRGGLHAMESRLLLETTGCVNVRSVDLPFPRWPRAADHYLAWGQRR
jgi:SAM-dependent methyltransferase